MIRARSTALLCLVFFLVVATAPRLAAAPQATEPDKPGCKDHPVFTRMTGMRLATCKTADFDRYVFKTGKTTQEAVEGRLYEIKYQMPAGPPPPSALAIIRNHQQAAATIGATVQFENPRYLVLKVTKDGKELWVQVDTAWGRGYLLTIVEKQAMVQDVQANAAVFQSGLKTTGHVEVPGVFFDTGKSELKPESDAAIAEIGKLLRAEPALKVFVVGHTDNVSSLDLNTKLSQARADAVVQALIAKHGIVAARLVGRGVGPLAPVASNDTEEGRAKNRRVELVKQ
jgi:outer membrane protein OmpA-like peptidoglycan-associated protein